MRSRESKLVLGAKYFLKKTRSKLVFNSKASVYHLGLNCYGLQVWFFFRHIPMKSKLKKSLGLSDYVLIFFSMCCFISNKNLLFYHDLDCKRTTLYYHYPFHIIILSYLFSFFFLFGQFHGCLSIFSN